MLGIYVLTAIIGLPLIGYALFAGDGEADFGDTGELGLELGGGAGSIVAWLSLGTLSFFSGFFGLTGLVATAVGSGAVATFLGALFVGLVAAGSHRLLLNWIRASSSSSHVGDEDLTGRAARVVLPIEDGRRGRIALEVGEQQHYLTAELTEGEQPVSVNDNVVIVSMSGGVAHVTPIDSELA